MTQPGSSTSDAYISAGQHGDAWAAEAASRGSVGTQRLLRVAITDPADDVRDALGLRPGEQVVLRSRLILSDGQPVEVATSYYPADIAESTRLARNEKIKGGAIAVLVEQGHTPAAVVERLTARWPDDDEAAALEVDSHEPLLILTRTSMDAGGTPVEFAVNVSVARRTTPHVYRLKAFVP